MTESLQRTLAAVAAFYDRRQVGTLGPLGYRRTTELRRLLACVPNLISAGVLEPGHSCFLDLGCGDGRVNVFMSYLTHVSVGVEIEDWILDEYGGLRRELDATLARQGLEPVPRNIRLLSGDATDARTYRAIRRATGLGFAGFDIFYTFLTAHEEFAHLIAARGKRGCTFLVYGMNRIFPCYRGLERDSGLTPLGDVLAVYRKPGD